MKKIILFSILFFGSLQIVSSENYIAKEYSYKGETNTNCFEVSLENGILKIGDCKYFKIIKQEPTFFDSEFEYTFKTLKAIDSENKICEITIAIHETKPSKLIIDYGKSDIIYVITKKETHGKDKG